MKNDENPEMRDWQEGLQRFLKQIVQCRHLLKSKELENFVSPGDEYVPSFNLNDIPKDFLSKTKSLFNFVIEKASAYIYNVPEL